MLLQKRRLLVKERTPLLNSVCRNNHSSVSPRFTTPGVRNGNGSMDMDIMVGNTAFY